ncbi:MAG: Fe-S cluster assembly protein HesB [Actinomycetes bacterium]
MLTLTSQAKQIVSRIGTHPSTSETVGVRISRGGVSSSPMGVALADAPHDGDQVVECDGGRIYLGPLAVDALTGKILDAKTDATGRVQFSISLPAA